MRKILLFLLLITVLIVGLYFSIFNDFFQQDEWAGLGMYYMTNGGDFWKYISDAFIPDPGHYVPLYKIVIATSFKLFEFEYWKWAALSVSWHIANSLLVYFLAQKIFKNNFQALCSSVLFAVFASGHQATSWILADGATHGATFFILLSLIFLFRSKTTLSLVALVVSMLFKEIGIGMFLFMPTLIAFQNYKKKVKVIDKNVIFFIATGGLYFLFRYLTFLGIFSDIVSPIITESQNLREIFVNIGTFPVKAVSQTLIPIHLLLELSKYLANRLPDAVAGSPGTTFFDFFYLKYVLTVLVWGMFFFLLLLVALVIKATKNKNTSIILFSLAFVMINSLIYAMSPGRSGFVPIIDSRNLYLPSIGTIFLIVSVSGVLFKNWRLSALLLFIFFGMNVITTKIELNRLSDMGGVRREILQKIYSDNLKLNKSQIFYIQSDTSYYGLPDNVHILPFQSGIGQTLLVWYQRTENFPTDFFAKEYLWPIDSQGYKEIDGRGFGYFREYSLLKSTLKEYNLPVDAVVSYSWNSKFNILTNITEEVRTKLKN